MKYKYKVIVNNLYSLKIGCRIWQNTLNSLIDFNEDKNTSLSILVDNSGYLYKKESKLLFSKVPVRNAFFLCKIVPHNDVYEIDLDESESKDIIDLEDVPWIITRYVFNNINDQHYILLEGDLIKIGKYILKIRQIKLKKENMVNTMIENQLKIMKDEEDEDISRNLFNSKEVANCLKIKSASLRDHNIMHFLQENNKLLLKDNNNNYNIKHEKDNDNKNEQRPICRICLSDSSQDLNDPMINPCKCSGTMKYLHLICLQKLIESKIHTTKSDNITVLTFKSIECDICKTVFPEKIRIKDTLYVIVNLHRPINNYIIIEGMSSEAPENKSIFIIDLKHNHPITIGRAANSDMKLGDISVSRNHSEIVLKNNTLQLIDKKSKFGTLINSSQHLSILPNKPLVIQKRQINLKFKMCPKLCTILSCYHPKDLPYKTYNEYLKAMSKFKRNIKELSNSFLTETQTVDGYESECDNEQRLLSEKHNRSK